MKLRKGTVKLNTVPPVTVEALLSQNFAVHHTVHYADPVRFSARYSVTHIRTGSTAVYGVPLKIAREALEVCESRPELWQFGEFGTTSAPDATSEFARENLVRFRIQSY